MSTWAPACRARPRQDCVSLTDAPGIGFESKAAFYKVLRDLHG
ncbi:hypothetical protein [Streptomyces sp. NPDC004270]